MVDAVLAIGGGAQRPVERALAQVVLEFKRLAEADAVVLGDLPVDAPGGEEVMQRRVGKDAVDALIFGVTHADEIGAFLLAVFHGDEPPGFVAANGAAGVGCVLLAVEGRRCADGGIVGGGQALQRLVALVEGHAAMQLVGALAGDHVDDRGAGAAQRC